MPACEIGVSNAWTLMVLLFLAYIPGRLINKETMNKVNEGWSSEKRSKLIESWFCLCRKLALFNFAVDTY